MKNILKKFWPLLSLGILLLVAGCVLLLWNARSTPEKAVEDFITASCRYDDGLLLDSASEYQKVVLAGNSPMDDETLEEYMANTYSYARETWEGDLPEVIFAIDSVEELAYGTEAYTKYLEEYGEKADAGEIEAMAIVTGTYRKDDGPKEAFRVLTVRCGGKWYYGFGIYEAK